MLTTPSNLISRSMRLIGAIGSGETPTSAEITDGLDALNAMLDSWWNERLAVFAIQEQTFTLTGAQDYTIGTGGTFNTTRPLKIETAYVSLSGVNYNLSVVDEVSWSQILIKTLTGIPSMLYYEPTVPQGIIHLYFVPMSGLTLTIANRRQIQSFATATDIIVLPPGYVDAMSYNLAVRIAPEFGPEASPGVMKLAMETKANIKRLNSTPPQTATSDAMYLGGNNSGGEFNSFGRYPVP